MLINNMENLHIYIWDIYWFSWEQSKGVDTVPFLLDNLDPEAFLGGPNFH